MKILLVRPPRIKQAITLSDFMFSEPLGLEMIYGSLKTNLYVNIFINKNTEMIKKFGIINIFRILKGSLKAVKKYIALMNE